MCLRVCTHAAVSVRAAVQAACVLLVTPALVDRCLGTICCCSAVPCRNDDSERPQHVHPRRHPPQWILVVYEPRTLAAHIRCPYSRWHRDKTLSRSLLPRIDHERDCREPMSAPTSLRQAPPLVDKMISTRLSVCTRSLTRASTCTPYWLAFSLRTDAGSALSATSMRIAEQHHDAFICTRALTFQPAIDAAHLPHTCSSLCESLLAHLL